MSKDLFITLDEMGVVQTNATTSELQTIDDFWYYDEFPIDPYTKYSTNINTIRRRKKKKAGKK